MKRVRAHFEWYGDGDVTKCDGCSGEAFQEPHTDTPSVIEGDRVTHLIYRVQGPS